MCFKIIKRVCFALAAIVTAATAGRAPAGYTCMTSDSSAFEWNYEMDVMPSAEDIDGNGTPDYVLVGDLGSSVSDGILTHIGGTGINDAFDATASGTIWPEHFTTGDWTMEIRAKVLSQGETASD